MLLVAYTPSFLVGRPLAMEASIAEIIVTSGCKAPEVSIFDGSGGRWED